MSAPEEQVDVDAPENVEDLDSPVAVEGDVKDTREHVNIVFIGHVDAGKSTMSGQILVTTGQVDKRTMERYQKEAKEKNRESWYLAYILDTSDEERARGKTVECGKAGFETEKKRYTLLDAPGHNAYVPSMIAGASQSDVGCLVISARKGEFEAGFEKGGQTLEHMMLIKTMGVQRLFVLINKMDDPSVNWSKERYDDICKKLSKTLKSYNFSSSEYQFIPVSAITGANVKDKYTAEAGAWYPGQTFFEALDEMAPIFRPTGSPLRVTVSARYKDKGVLSLLGKVESGILTKDDAITVVPTGRKLNIVAITANDVMVSSAPAGSNVIIDVKGIDEEEIGTGHVLCPANKPGYRSNMVEAQVMITDLNPQIPVVTVGYSCVMHIHSATVEVKVKALVQELDRKGGVAKEHPAFLKVGSIGVVRLELEDHTALEKASEFPSLGRFTLRDKTKTIGIGKIIRLKPT
jgi:peptide chain release factor subunit 3